MIKGSLHWSLASSLPNLASKVDAHFVHYKRGEVVLVKFPMPDLSQFKPRPALVIQNDVNNQRLKNIILFLHRK
ncbi:MAG: type II toxin-antitoxin system PemK/MazF family toxin [Methanosarcinales archaeon]